MEPNTLDCRGLKCPMPIVQTALAMRALGMGEVLTVEATDPAFLPDIRAWAEVTGNALDSEESDGEIKRARIRKVAA